MTTRRILWERRDVPGLEWCELASTPAGTDLRGVALLSWESAPHRVEYAIHLDERGLTRSVRITAEGGAEPVTLELEADGAGRWTRADAVVVDSPNALDLDLGFSPSTNTLPIRRLGLAVGESREIEVAWVLFPSFEVIHGRQTYERLGERTWRYRSSGFVGDLEVDDDGLVQSYAEWRAIARG